MANVNSVLYTAKQALLSNLTAINVTGSNIANVSTDGYTRLRPVFESVGTKDAASNQEQIGVKIAEIQRIYDKFLQSQIVQQDAAVGSATANNNLLTQIEGIMNESTGGGVNDAISQFWSAWGNLSANPSGQAERDVLVSAAQNLTNIFNQRAGELSDIQRNVDQTIVSDVDKLNGYLRDMAAMNVEISNTVASGGQATSEKDNQLSLMRKISSIIDVNYVEMSDGSFYISLPSNGKALVEENNSWQLSAQNNPANSNLSNIVFTDDPGTSLDNYIKGGELGGLLNIRDVILPAYINELNQTADSVINKVNSQHMAGYDQDGNIGGAFFDPTKMEAKNMQVSDTIVADTKKIAASSTVNADGDNATAIAAIKDDKMYASLGQIFSAHIGVDSGSATGQINNVGQAYKNTTAPIVITRGATAGSWVIAPANKGGYNNATVLSSSDSKVTVDLDNNGTADITFNLSGTWGSGGAGDTITFSLTKLDSTTNIDGYYSAFMARMGQDVASSSTTLEREKTIATQQNDQREQLSGVSLDEEMLNLIKYQMAYNAAGRVTKTVAEMMDTLISLGQ